MALGVTGATISRHKDQDLERSCQIIAALGLKVVPVDMKCYRPEDIDPYIQIAKQHMAMMNSIEQLSVDDPE